MQERAALGGMLGLRWLWTPRWRQLVCSGVNGMEPRRDLGRHKSFRIAGGHGTVLGYTAKETAAKENRMAGVQEPAEASDSEFVVTWSALLCGFLQPSSPAGGGREAQLD